MRYRITHVTQYHYAESVSRCHNEARLTPFNNETQTCFVSRVVVAPKPKALIDRCDYFGNTVTSFDIHRQHETLTVKVDSEVVTIVPKHNYDAIEHLSWEQCAQQIRHANDPETAQVREFILPSPMIPVSEVAFEFAQAVFTTGKPVLQAITDLMHTIYKEFSYQPGVTSVATSLQEIYENRKGVCQDFSHVAIACLRSVGLPGKYISGYIETQPPPGKKKLLGSDASHAWFATYIPSYGWLAFDPTNDQPQNEKYIVVGQGRDFSDVTPLKGVVYGGGQHQLNVSVDVIPQQE